MSVKADKHPVSYINSQSSPECRSMAECLPRPWVPSLATKAKTKTQKQKQDELWGALLRAGCSLKLPVNFPGVFLRSAAPWCFHAEVPIHQRGCNSPTICWVCAPLRRLYRLFRKFLQVPSSSETTRPQAAFLDFHSGTMYFGEGGMLIRTIVPVSSFPPGLPGCWVPALPVNDLPASIWASLKKASQESSGLNWLLVIGNSFF